MNVRYLKSGIVQVLYYAIIIEIHLYYAHLYKTTYPLLYKNHFINDFCFPKCPFLNFGSLRITFSHTSLPQFGTKLTF